MVVNEFRATAIRGEGGATAAFSRAGARDGGVRRSLASLGGSDVEQNVLQCGAEPFEVPLPHVVVSASLLQLSLASGRR